MDLAREEGERRIAEGAGIDWDMVEHNATRLRDHGFLATILHDQNKLRTDRSVLDLTTARAFAHDQAELDRLENMAAGAPQLVGKNFSPIGVVMSANELARALMWARPSKYTSPKLPVADTS